MNVNGVNSVVPDVIVDLPAVEAPVPEAAVAAPIPEASAVAPIPDVDELQKAVLHDSADRARRRRQEEEEERIRAQERARQKAAELEARLAAANASKVKFKPVIPPVSSTQPQHSEVRYVFDRF